MSHLSSIYFSSKEPDVKTSLNIVERSSLKTVENSSNSKTLDQRVLLSPSATKHFFECELS